MNEDGINGRTIENRNVSWYSVSVQFIATINPLPIGDMGRGGNYTYMHPFDLHSLSFNIRHLSVHSLTYSDKLFLFSHSELQLSNERN